MLSKYVGLGFTYLTKVNVKILHVLSICTYVALAPVGIHTIANTCCVTRGTITEFVIW